MSAAVRLRPSILDRYILRQVLGTMFGVLAIVLSVMTLEHLPRLLDATRFSGRSGYIVANTLIGLLPEYGGIGLPVGLFLGIALTVRRLAVRGELDVIEACGIAASRWMRLPLTLAAAASIVTLVTQGWLVPAGETKIAELHKRMSDGEFGQRLRAGQFIDLGSGNVMLFEEVDARDGGVTGLFLRTEEEAFAARAGRLWQLPSGAVAVELRDGNAVRLKKTRAVSFADLRFTVGRSEPVSDTRSSDGFLKQSDIGSLWAHGTTSSRSAAYGRCLWAALVLFLPSLALRLGKPPRRQTGAAGILAGMIALVLGLKMVTPLMDGQTYQPEAQAAAILLIWVVFTAGLTRAEKLFGQGFVDLWVGRLVQEFRRRAM